MGVSGLKDTWDGQLETLDDLSEAIHYNQWIYGMMEPYLGSKVIEIGCGIGNMTGLLAQGRDVLGIDIHPWICQNSPVQVQENKKNISFRVVDMGKRFPSFNRFKPDTIVCINVFEHIQADRLFLKECFKLLPPRGRVLIFVPALPFLYGSMDSSYGHFRRYDKGDLTRKMRDTGFSVLKMLTIFKFIRCVGVVVERKDTEKAYRSKISNLDLRQNYSMDRTYRKMVTETHRPFSFLRR